MAARRVVRGVAVGALTLVAGLLVAPGAEVHAGAPEHRSTVATLAGAGIPLSGPRAFSPNGDGVQDTARFRYVLRRAGSVTMEVRDASGRQSLRLRQHLGRKAAGRHVWSWDGRLAGDRPAADAAYVVRVTSGRSSTQVPVEVDRRFRVRVAVDPSYGARRREPVVVYPRTRVVRDTVGLRGVALERRVSQGRLLLRGPGGRVVARAALRDRGELHEAHLTWAARGPSGRPLAPGSYTVDVRGTDRAGNPATTRPFAVHVSGRKLGWRTETLTVAAVDSLIGPCTRSTAQGCGDVAYCGTVVPSALFAGGLSLRSATCADRTPGISSLHLATVPEALRGIDSYRVAFTGAPTRAGETDPLTLRAGDHTTTSSSTGRTPWLTSGPYLDGDPRDLFLPPLLPSVLWSVETIGDDSFDVASFTLEMRYLAVGG